MKDRPLFSLVALARLLMTRVRGWATPNLRVFFSTKQPTVWALSVVIGLGVAILAIGFRLLIGLIQYPWLGTTGEKVARAAEAAPWYLVIAAPTLGGLAVGLILHYLMPGRRAESVADVIEARALTTKRLGFRTGALSALVSAISLGAGASAGREGPVVHLGATFANLVTRQFSLPAGSARMLLAAGVGAAVSASFNAPIAGVLFAHEVILGHYALSAFVPIVIASVLAAVASRLYFGDYPAFFIPEYQITSYWEVPAFALLGLTCAVVAILFQFALIGTDWAARNVRMHLILRPIVGGFVVGLIGLAVPEIMGVGYESTDQALNQLLPVETLLLLLVAKTVATAITLASRFGGGIFSPSLYIGAMTGGAFGLIAAGVFPDLASSAGLYAILGMGAVAAAVLGAPVSTTVIVFELTGGYAVTLALLLTVSIANGLTQAVHGRSYFQWQLESRGLFLQDGAHRRLGRQIRVADIMRPPDEDEDTAFDPESDPDWLSPNDTLELSLRLFDDKGLTQVPVVSELSGKKELVGHLHQVDALRRFTDALIEANVEEHR